jgi:hypothetical protein
MDINNRLKLIEDSTDYYVIDVSDEDNLMVPIKLSFYEIVEYSELVRDLNRARYACDTYEEKELFVEKYIKIYLSSRKVYTRILRNLRKGIVKIIYPETLDDEYFYEMLKKFTKFHKDKSLEENLKEFMKGKLKQKIHDSNEELFKLKHYPAEYINTLSNYVGTNVLKYRNDIIMYKDVYIAATESHSYSVYYNEKTIEDTKNSLLNILSYLNGHPSFYFTENYNFNKKLSELYEQFDLLDMLRLRKRNFFESKKNSEPIYLELPILQRKNNYHMVYIEESNYEMIFELYHASLKQFESLPRCVFLYRVFEYGAIKHYQPLINPANYRPEDALNYYVNEIMTHRYIPLYYVDYGTYIDDEKHMVIRRRKEKYINITTKLKEEVKKIQKEWSNHPYLKNKSIGSIIYGTGRNAAAHGGSGRGNARYDYDKNYKHLNDVNIFLELIARYIIEKLNPQLESIVERKTKYYIEHNN